MANDQTPKKQEKSTSSKVSDGISSAMFLLSTIYGIKEGLDAKRQAKKERNNELLQTTRAINKKKTMNDSSSSYDYFENRVAKGG